MFNALKYTEKLEDVGFSRDQAESSLNIAMEIMVENLASKQDLQNVKNELEVKVKDLRNELKEDIRELRAEFKLGMKQLELRLTLKMWAMQMTSVALTVGLIKYL